MLAFIIENTLLSHIMAYMRSDKCKMLLYNLIIVFFKLICQLGRDASFYYKKCFIKQRNSLYQIW